MNDRLVPPWRLADALDAMSAGTLTALALAETQLVRIAATDARIEAWAHLDPAHVRAEAWRCDETPRAARGPLSGVGVGVKDIFATTGLPTEHGSPIFAGRRPAQDAEAVARLRRAGAYVFGKTVTTEFAYYRPGKTRNPWDARHTPGGSSSGSAAAVAAGHVLAAIGTQTNGSMIRPAAFCGVVGFKPTKDAIPYAGAFAFSPTLDQVGTYARDVAGAARLASAIADPGRVPAAVAPPSRPPRVALLAGFPWTVIDADAAAALAAAAVRLRQAGADLAAVEIPPPWCDAHLVLRTIMLREAATGLGALQERERARMSAELNAGLDEGRATSPADYEAALRRREEAIGAFTQWLDGMDAVISPPARGAAPADLASTGDPACCSLWSLTGFPAISIPIGRSAGGLPFGMQIASPPGTDDRLLAVAAWCEGQLPFAARP